MSKAKAGKPRRIKPVPIVAPIVTIPGQLPSARCPECREAHDRHCDAIRTYNSLKPTDRAAVTIPVFRSPHLVLSSHARRNRCLLNAGPAMRRVRRPDATQPKHRIAEYVADPREAGTRDGDGICDRCGLAYAHLLLNGLRLCRECYLEDVAEVAAAWQKLGINLGWHSPRRRIPKGKLTPQELASMRTDAEGTKLARIPDADRDLDDRARRAEAHMRRLHPDTFRGVPEDSGGEVQMPPTENPIDENAA